MVNGENVTQLDVIRDIADFCKIGEESIKFYKNNKSIPSLPVAIRLAQYFHVHVDEIFSIDDYEEVIKNLSKKGRKPRPYNKKCKFGECKNEVVAKGLCGKHYQQARSGIIKVDE